jgi:hypothetical protein
MLSVVLVKVDDWAGSGRPGAAPGAPISCRFCRLFLALFGRLARSNFINGVKMM